MKYGSQHGRWIGERAGYSACHKRVAALKGKANRCDMCGLANPNRKYHWANLTGNLPDPTDYKRMCVPCHRKYDYSRVPPKKKTHCKYGHEFTPENTYKATSKGGQKCKTCALRVAREQKRKKREFLRLHLKGATVR